MLEEEGPNGQPDWEYKLEQARMYIIVIERRLAAISK
jgi:hypothetical protein